MGSSSVSLSNLELCGGLVDDRGMLSVRPGETVLVPIVLRLFAPLVRKPGTESSRNVQVEVFLRSSEADSSKENTHRPSDLLCEIIEFQVGSDFCVYIIYVFVHSLQSLPHI